MFAPQSVFPLLHVARFFMVAANKRKTKQNPAKPIGKAGSL
jgi:hypothetical protein